jgi:hypothetical protein
LNTGKRNWVDFEYLFLRNRSPNTIDLLGLKCMIWWMFGHGEAEDGGGELGDSAEAISGALDSCDRVAPFGCYSGYVDVPHKMPGFDWMHELGMDLGTDEDGNPTATFDENLVSAWNSAVASEQVEVEKLCKECCCEKITKYIQCQTGGNPDGYAGTSDVNWIIRLMITMLRASGGIENPDQPVCGATVEYDCKTKTWGARVVGSAVPDSEVY